MVPKPQQAMLAHKGHSAGSLTCPSGANFRTEFQVHSEYHIANKLSPANARAVVFFAIEYLKIFYKFEMVNLYFKIFMGKDAVLKILKME